MPPRRLLVPVANPETADRLMDTAADIALDRDLGILVLTVVEVPRQLPLTAAREQLDVSQSERVLEQAMDRAIDRGVGVNGRIRFGRDIARSIRTVAETEPVEALLMGWRRRPRRRDIVLGRHLDTILAGAPCDVIVKRIDRAADSIGSVLVPVAGGPNTEFAAGVAGSIARTCNADVELLSIVDSEAEMGTGRDLLEETTSAVGPVRSITQTVLAGPVVGTIVDRSGTHDLTIVGTAEGGLLQRTLVGTVPEQIARDADGAVLMVKRQPGRPWTLLKRLSARISGVLNRH